MNFQKLIMSISLGIILLWFFCAIFLISGHVDCLCIV